jgi:glycine betaine/proline transport system permease protein
MPILDVMQTMPAFVYLIRPFRCSAGACWCHLFHRDLRHAAGNQAHLPGIKQVPVELVEAADAFGSTKGQKLFKLQLPMATPTIMAGINQTIMLALSMVVIDP